MSSSHIGLRGLSLLNSRLTGVVFAGKNGLDFLELRLGVFRIPEVSMRVREAQQILDLMTVERIDLMASLIADDDSFFRNVRLKELLAAIVQVGLYDRLLKTRRDAHRAPDVLVGHSRGDSALLVCAGQMSFEDMVRSSAAMGVLRSRDIAEAAPSILGVPVSATTGLPIGLAQPLNVLAFDADGARTDGGQAAESEVEFRAFIRGEAGFTELGLPVTELKKLLTEIIQHQDVGRFINIGPGDAIMQDDCNEMAEAAGSDEVTVMDSIDLDPMLNWFWREMRPVVGLAQ